MRDCLSCGADLRIIDDCSGEDRRGKRVTTKPTIHEHYRCPECRTGGTIVRERTSGRTVRKLGPAVRHSKQGAI